MSCVNTTSCSTQVGSSATPTSPKEPHFSAFSAFLLIAVVLGLVIRYVRYRQRVLILLDELSQEEACEYLRHRLTLIPPAQTLERWQCAKCKRRVSNVSRGARLKCRKCNITFCEECGRERSGEFSWLIALVGRESTSSSARNPGTSRGRDGSSRVYIEANSAVPTEAVVAAHSTTLVDVVREPVQATHQPIYVSHYNSSYRHDDMGGEYYHDDDYSGHVVVVAQPVSEEDHTYPTYRDHPHPYYHSHIQP